MTPELQAKIAELRRLAAIRDGAGELFEQLAWSHQLAILSPALADALEAAEAEIERLKRGDFTPEEFQNLCHHRDDKPGCTPEDFFTGCALYQQKLFGMAAFASLMEENERLREALKPFAEGKSC